MTAATTSFAALGTTATLVVTEPDTQDEALDALRAELDAIDRAASRFRSDSELSRLNGAHGQAFAVSPLFLEALEAALRAAQLTQGRVDPTVGGAMRVIGYDRDFAAIGQGQPTVRIEMRPVPGWQAVRIDRPASLVQLPAGVELDLGATAKALCADRAARAIAAATNAGVLVSLGGDIAVAGSPPEGGWVVRVTHDHAAPPSVDGPTISLRSGGLATSSTSVRRWLHGGRSMHHLVDPATGSPAREYWRTVSVAAGSCLDANTASCAAIILGPEAPDWLAARGLPSRLVNPAGRVTAVGGWPPEGNDVPCP